MNRMISAAILVAMLMLTSCASVLSSKYEDVTFTSTPSGRQLTIVCEDTHVSTTITTPATLTLVSGDDFAGYEYSIHSGGLVVDTFDSHMNGWGLVNVLFGLGGVVVGGVIDMGTGAAYDLSDDIHVDLR